jgi:hypothetical protein
VWCKQLTKEVELEQLDSSLQGGEVDCLEVQCHYLQEQCEFLHNQLQESMHHTPMSEDDDVNMRSGTLAGDSLDQSKQTLVSFNKSVEDAPWNQPRMHHPEESTGELSPVHLSLEAVMCITAAHDDTNIPQEHKFQVAQCQSYMTGEHPLKSKCNRCCMAALIKVNGLEAYTLMDSGSTTISVTHDFACMAELDVMQLENPVALQLRMVGSCSMINFSTKTHIKLGPVIKNDVYLDVVNIN